jgi:hypothetical protein
MSTLAAVVIVEAEIYASFHSGARIFEDFGAASFSVIGRRCRFIF